MYNDIHNKTETRATGDVPEKRERAHKITNQSSECLLMTPHWDSD